MAESPSVKFLGLDRKLSEVHWWSPFLGRGRTCPATNRDLEEVRASLAILEAERVTLTKVHVTQTEVHATQTEIYATQTVVYAA